MSRLKVGEGEGKDDGKKNVNVFMKKKSDWRKTKCV